jgi:hypothetical protein
MAAIGKGAHDLIRRRCSKRWMPCTRTIDVAAGSHWTAISGPDSHLERNQCDLQGRCNARYALPRFKAGRLYVYAWWTIAVKKPAEYVASLPGDVKNSTAFWAADAFSTPN